MRGYLREHGIGPSRAEVARALGLRYRSTADAHLNALVRKGWIELKRHGTRHMRLPHDDVPVVLTGPIAAQGELLAHERIVDQVPRAAAEWFEPTPDLFVEMDDDSMSEAGLIRGDLAAVRAGGDAPTGEIVVVHSATEVSLRRLWRIDGQRIRLSPESTDSAHHAHVVDLTRDEVRIEGMVIGALIGRRPAQSVIPAREGDESAAHRT